MSLLLITSKQGSFLVRISFSAICISLLGLLMLRYGIFSREYIYLFFTIFLTLSTAFGWLIYKLVQLRFKRLPFLRTIKDCFFAAFWSVSCSVLVSVLGYYLVQPIVEQLMADRMGMQSCNFFAPSELLFIGVSFGVLVSLFFSVATCTVVYR